jgi:hypothetical protein
MPNLRGLSGIEVDKDENVSMPSTSSIHGINKRERRQLYEQIEKVQTHLKRPVMISRISSRLASRLGKNKICRLLQKSEEEDQKNKKIKNKDNDVVVDIRIGKNTNSKRRLE